MVAGAALVSALVTGLAVWRLNQSPPKPVLRFSMTAAAGVPFVVETNHNDVAITPDGKAIAYFSRAGTENQLVVRRLDQFDGTALVASKIGANARGPFVSPDSGWLGYMAGDPMGAKSRLQKVPLSGGSPVPLCEIDGNLRGASWGTNQTIVFATVSRTTGLWSVPSGGGTAEMLTKPGAGEADHLFPHQLPDGKHVLFAIMRPDGSDIGLLSLETRQWRVLVKDGQAPRYLATGHIVYAAQGGIRAIAFDPKRLQVRGDPIEVQAGVVAKESGAADFDVSGDGSLAYLPGNAVVEPYELFWRDAKGVETPTGITIPDLFSLSLSPDGRFAAALGNRQASLGLVDFTRQITTNLPTTIPPIRNGPPAFWTPDGRQVGFSTVWLSEASPGGLHQVPVTGTGETKRLTTSAAGIFHGTAAWTPDGRHLLFDRRRGREELDILRLTPGEGAEPEPLLSGAYFPAISPDGHFLAHTSAEGTALHVYVRPYPNVNDARIPVSVGTSYSPSWSRDGRELFFTGNSGTGAMRMVVQVEYGKTLSLGKPLPVVPLMDPTGRSVIIAAESSRRILVARQSAGTAAAPGEYRIVLNWGQEVKTRVP